ncbi:YccF domain-containing protein [Enterococcus caccae]
MENKVQKFLKRGIILIVSSVFLLCASLYTTYYEKTNLSSVDSTVIAQTYFITNEVNTQLHALQNGEDVKDSKEKLMELSSLLASYGSSTASNSLSKDGQQLLNRYYVQLREFGTNLYSLKVEQLSDSDTIEAYVADINKIKETQKKVFTRFKINEQALKQKK